MRKVKTQRQKTPGRASALQALEALGYRVTFADGGQFRVFPYPTAENIRFIERCAEQIREELCERIIDGYPYEAARFDPVPVDR